VAKEDPSKSPQEDPAQPTNDAGQPVETPAQHAVSLDRLRKLLQLAGEYGGPVLELLTRLVDELQGREPVVPAGARAAGHHPSTADALDAVIDAQLEALAAALVLQHRARGH
jgi:hypothetical protein